jgi:hypothetical protein
MAGMATPVHPEQLRISIEMGEAYEPTDRLSAALAELAAALGEAEAADDEVQGFIKGGNGEMPAFRTLSYDSLGLKGSTGSIAPKIASGVTEGIPKI